MCIRDSHVRTHRRRFIRRSQRKQRPILDVYKRQAEIGPHTGNSEILALAVEGRNAVILPRYQPPIFIKGGLHGKLVMLKCEVGFRCAIVSIFRADMFECCQQRHPLSARLQTLGQQGDVYKRQALDCGFGECHRPPQSAVLAPFQQERGTR